MKTTLPKKSNKGTLFFTIGHNLRIKNPKNEGENRALSFL